LEPALSLTSGQSRVTQDTVSFCQGIECHWLFDPRQYFRDLSELS
jgi:hypothetical protein